MRATGGDDGRPGTPGVSVDAVLAASRGLVAVAARSLAAVGDEVTLPQYRMLVVLTSHGPQHLSALADQLSVAPSTATRMCDRLVRKGFLRREPHPEDRRQVILATTDAGDALVAGVMDRRRAELTSLMDKLDSDEQRAVIEALERLAAAAGEAGRAGEEVVWPL